MAPHLISDTSSEKNGTGTALAVTAAAKTHSDSDVGMEIGNVDVEQEEPSDNHPLSSVVLCFSKKVAAQESKSLLIMSSEYLFSGLVPRLLSIFTLENQEEPGDEANCIAQSILSSVGMIIQIYSCSHVRTCTCLIHQVTSVNWRCLSAPSVDTD